MHSHISQSERRTATYLYVVGLLTVVNLFSYMDRMALAAMAPVIKTDLGLSDAQLGLLTGFAFSLFYAVCGIPIARWADRGIRRNIVALALTTWSMMTALSGAAQNFVQLFVARIGIGAGEAGCLPPSQSILCDYVPVNRRAGVFAIHNFGNYAGMMVGLVAAGALGERLGWRWAFVALGIPGVALALIVRFTLREPERGASEGVSSEIGKSSHSTLVRTLAVLIRCRTYRWMLSFYVLNGFTQYGLIQWWPSFYSRTFDLKMSSIGLSLGLAIGAGAGIGSLAGGWWAQRVAQRDIRLPLIMGGAITLLALPAAVGSVFYPNFEGAVFLVSSTALFWSCSNGAVIATAASVVAPSMRATSSSVIILATALLGFGSGPFFVGLLSDSMSDALGEHALRYAMLLPICLFPVIAFVLYAGSQTVKHDLAAVGKEPPMPAFERIVTSPSGERI